MLTAFVCLKFTRHSKFILHNEHKVIKIIISPYLQCLEIKSSNIAGEREVINFKLKPVHATITNTNFFSLLFFTIFGLQLFDSSSSNNQNNQLSASYASQSALRSTVHHNSEVVMSEKVLSIWSP